MPVSRDVARWGLRMLIGMDGEDNELVDFHRNGYDNLDDLRTSFMRTPEAIELFRTANNVNVKTYMIPPFLLQKPVSPKVPWCFERPSLNDPVSQLCTSEQMIGPRYRELCQKLKLSYEVFHRKTWEFTYILAALESKGMLHPGIRGLGFGTGKEMLPSLFANAGIEVTATDAPSDLQFSGAWQQSNQFATTLEDLWISEIVDHDTFSNLVEFRPADMNNISSDLTGYDFCWSACCLEHLGSIRHGLDYIKNSLSTLKVGGISVQTTEFNLMSNTGTLESPNLSVFRKHDIETVIEELVDEGHKVEPLNLWPGSMPVDEHIDLPPYSSPHLKLSLHDMTVTSIGLIITKGA